MPKYQVQLIHGVTNIPKKNEIYCVYDDKNYYLYMADSFDNFTIHAQIPIVGNERYIDIIDRNRSNGTYETPKGLVDIANSMWNEQAFDNSNYAPDKGQRGGREGLVHVDVQKQTDRQGGDGHVGEGVSEGTQRENNGSSEEEVNDSLLFREGEDDDVNRRYSIGDDRPEDNGEAVISSRR